MEALIADVTALVSVILIDLALAGDNAVAVGVAASAVPREQRQRVIFIGVALALVLRIAFALITLTLLQIQGILFVGGLLLLWVAWRMWQDIKAHGKQHEARGVEAGAAAVQTTHPAQHRSFWRALQTIIIADVSMSLDNVLAVAGVSRHAAPWIMPFGLILSVVLMGVAASFIARVIEKYRWIAILGIIIIVAAAVRMMWEDLHLWFPSVIPAIPFGGQPQAH